MASHHDEGKPRYDLIPAGSLADVVEVFTMGAKKYGDDNWSKGLSYRRYFGSIMRHLWAWFSGEDNDKESGINHLAHAAANCMILLAFHRNADKKWDDRPKEKA